MTPPEQVVIVDRPGAEGWRTSLTVERGRIADEWPVKVAVAVGYDGPTSLHLTTDEALALVDAVRAHVGPDPRIAELEAENEKLSEALGVMLREAAAAGKRADRLEDRLRDGAQ